MWSEWRGSLELPVNFESWANLPAGIDLNQQAFEEFKEFFIAVLVRDATLDEYLDSTGAKEYQQCLPQAPSL